MDTLLPLLFFIIMGLSVLAYGILDGYDLGIGMLLPLGNEADKDRQRSCRLWCECLQYLVDNDNAGGNDCHLYDDA